jgi:prepilin peptidase CpaA
MLDTSARLVVALLLAAATLADLRSRRIPLWLSLGGCGMGLLVAALTGFDTFVLSLAGFAVGVLLLVPLVLRGGFGGADALVLGMVGAWLGWPFILWAAWWTAIVGAILAIIVWRRGHRTLPYMPAIAIDVGIALLATH